MSLVLAFGWQGQFRLPRPTQGSVRRVCSVARSDLHVRHQQPDRVRASRRAPCASPLERLRCVFRRSRGLHGPSTLPVVLCSPPPSPPPRNPPTAVRVRERDARSSITATSRLRQSLRALAAPLLVSALRRAIGFPYI